MSGCRLHGGVDVWASSNRREGKVSQLLPPLITFGVSTSGGGLTPLTSVSLDSFEAGVDTPSADAPHFSVTWIDGVSGRSTRLLQDAAQSPLLILIEEGGFFGVSECCAPETVLLVWRDPRGWSDTTVDSVGFFVRALFGWWDWSLDLVWNDNEGNLHTLFFEDSELQASRTLVAERHFLLPRLAGSAAAMELSNCGLTWKSTVMEHLNKKNVWREIIIAQMNAKG